MKTETTFFSYSRADSEFVVKLAQDLRQGGAKVWLDQIDIGPGDRWDLSIEKALKDANRMLIVLSPDSVASHNVMDEVSFALEKGKQVIPILFKPCDVPFRLRRLQHIDFTKNYDKGIKKLLTELDTEANAAVQIENIDSNHLIDDTQDPEKTSTQKKKVLALFNRAEKETLDVFNEDKPQPNIEISMLWRNVGDALHRALSRERKGNLAERCYWKQEYWRNPNAYKKKYKGKRDHGLIELGRLRDDIKSAFDKPLDITGEGTSEIRILKIFLASSNELKPEREKIEQTIGRKNNNLRKEGIFIELLIWENNKFIGESFRSQDNYNLAVDECDFFTMLFYSKVGKYSSEEFEKAYSRFEKDRMPRLRLYQKDINLPKEQSKTDANSRFDFLDKLKELEHFPVLFPNDDALIKDLEDYIDKLLQDTKFVKQLEVK